MKVWIVGALLLILIDFAFTSCSDRFDPPHLPDLGHMPFDFSVVVPPEFPDAAVRDMATTD